MSRYSSISKRQRLIQDGEDRDRDDQRHPQQHDPLLPGLPDHVAHLCLSTLHPSVLYGVCSSWRRLIYSPSFPPFLSVYSLLATSSPPPATDDSRPSSSAPSTVYLFAFDPISSRWDPLPTPPDPPLNRLLLHHPSFLSRNFPVQSVSVSGKLVLLAATSRNLNPALARPLIFDPARSLWLPGPEFHSPRRWCAAGSLRGAVYVASGIGSQFSTDVARSAERWELGAGGEREWEKVREMKDGRFSREAIDAVGWKGKLCVVNAAGAEGVFYDAVEDAWRDMPEGMVKGWKRGPVAAMDEELLYAVDSGCGVLSEYDECLDEWREVVQSELLKGARHVAAGGGKVCAVCTNYSKGCGGIVVVDVTAVMPRAYAVAAPRGLQALTVHVLPRMSILNKLRF